eukprot:gene6763-20689_t
MRRVQQARDVAQRKRYQVRASEELHKRHGRKRAGDSPLPARGIAAACAAMCRAGTRLRESLRRLGWEWPAPERLRPGAGAPDLDLREVAPGRLAHEVREAARRAEWRAAAARRDDVKGIEGGIDRDATWAAHRRSRLAPYALGVLRTCLCGGAWTQDRLHRCGVVDTAECPHCPDGVLEDQRHRYWRCSAWDAIRRRHAYAVSAYREDWPACLACCGVMPEGLEPQ